MMFPMNHLLSVYLFAIAIFFGSNRWQSRFAYASNFNKPHSHTGKVEPFQPGDPKVKLDGKALRILKDGKPYQTQVQTKDSGRGLVVQDVDAPTNIVWDRILDYDNYANMVPKTVDSKNYNIIPHKPSKSNNFLEKEIFTRMKVGFPMLKLEFFVRHFLYIQHHKSLTWTLDYTKESDFDDSCGYWYIIPHPDDPEGKTRLYYSVQVSMFDWVPKFVVDFMSSKALTDATAWVKKYSEIEWAKVVASGGGPQSVEGEGSKPAVQKESIFSRFFPFVNKKKREEEERVAAEAAAKAQALEEQEKTESRKRLLVVRAGWRRYVLVSVVLVLAMYNASLFLGGMHEKSQ
mmetsp:Transcript_9667/g.20292  ORF Transcript_9667/g.20292 Transcript_9667/m.20292 type:complete len:346 (+) Transcript_9667:40-1077(+)